MIRLSALALLSLLTLACASERAATNSTYDARFLDTMIQHDKQAIALAMGALQSGRAEVRDFAQRSLDRHREEVTQMLEWRSQWYPYQPVQVLQNTRRRHFELMAEDADDAFLSTMLRHYEEGMFLAEEAGRKAEHLELKRYARQLALTREEQMETLIDLR